MHNILGELPTHLPTQRTPGHDHAAVWVEPTFAELRDCVGDAFLRGAATKSDLLNAALGCAARREVFAALNRLPELRFAALTEVWSHLTPLGGHLGGEAREA
ncbi:hypothetical protein JOD54_004248 [Actinokineospora baliensis]|uniref:hypothetical protein n=1 Tax=Actinokineospora baliensis TaxID=547056 RepID=UPI001959DFDD|nr:hypothetical protein [Actinokineospora baliensis]MBM7774044.1 hypothetical protein [Actinokineospora baliensis]